MSHEDCENIFCHDCRKKISLNGEDIINGVFLRYKDPMGDYTIVKCNDCYQRNPQLANYKKCEVYSRIVGYIRPVNQWNDGKQQEFRERKTYKTKKV